MKNVLESYKYTKNRRSTKNTYHTVWRKFNEFVIRLDTIPKTWEERASLYCVYLIEEKRVQSATLRSYISAIKSKLTADDYEWNDDLVLLSTLTSNCQLQNDHVKTRLPIRRHLLNLLLFEIGRIYDTQPFLKLLYRAIFIIAYYGMLRIGEITSSDDVIKAKNVYVSRQHRTMLFYLYSSKTHSCRTKPQSIRIKAADRQHSHKNKSSMECRTEIFCSFEILSAYNEARGGYLNENEQLFVFSDNSPVTASHVRKVLRKCLRNLTLNHKLYTTHSFRSGRASDMLREHRSIEYIKRCGRWRSNAVYKYLHDSYFLSLQKSLKELTICGC